MDLLGTVHLVAVFDGVDEGFFKGELDAEDLAFLEVAGLEGAFDVILNAACLGGVAGDHNLVGTDVARITHGAVPARKEQVRHRIDLLLGRPQSVAADGPWATVAPGLRLSA